MGRPSKLTDTQKAEARRRAELVLSGLILTPCWRELDSNPRSPRKGQHFLRPPRNRATMKLAGSQSRILTIDKGRFTVRRARLAPAMISTPGHRASRRRQRGALPAWSRDAFSAPSTN